MMNKLILMLSLISFSITIHSKETIIWRVTDWPPMYILEGPDKGKGLYDELITMFQKALPEFNHKNVVMNTTRAVRQMDKGDNYCHTSVMMKRVKGKYSISKLNSILLAHRIIIRSDKKGLIDNPSIMSIDDLIQNPILKGGLTSFRTHNALKKYEKDKEKLKLMYIEGAYKQMLHVLFLGRVDYTIQYTPVVRYHEKQFKKLGITDYIDIKESLSDPYINVYTACADTEIGRKVISKVDKVIEAERLKKKLEEIQLRWYDEKSKTRLKSYYKKEYELEKKKY